MQELTLQELFGGSAVQTADELIIKKSDLSTIGLTPSANNCAQQLVVAILLQALSAFQGYLADENGNIITDESSSIGYDNSQLHELLEVFRWKAYARLRNRNIYLTQTIVINSYAQAN